MKNWTTITSDEVSVAKKSGATWALGYLALLRLEAAGRNEIKTSLRDLAALLDLADLRAVKRTLDALQSARLIAAFSGPRGTLVRFLSVEQSSTQVLRNPLQSVEQSSTLPPFPPYPLNPKSETFIINKQQKNNIYINSAQAFEEKDTAHQFGLWFLQRYCAHYFAKADARTIKDWFKTHGPAAKKAVNLALGDLKLAQQATIMTEQDMSAYSAKNPSAKWSLEGAVIRNMADNVDFILKQRRNDEIDTQGALDYAQILPKSRQRRNKARNKELDQHKQPLLPQ